MRQPSKSCVPSWTFWGLWAVWAVVSTTALQGAEADLILRNGRVVTVDAKFTIQQAVAIKGGKIAAAGSDVAVLRSQRGPKTKVVDLVGRMILPGLVDSHVHALNAGLSEFRGPLLPLDSYAAVRAYIAQKAAITPRANGSWCPALSRRG
jgi:predicted amidohydrolase YtcJ